MLDQRLEPRMHFSILKELKVVLFKVSCLELNEMKQSNTYRIKAIYSIEKVIKSLT